MVKIAVVDEREQFESQHGLDALGQVDPRKLRQQLLNIAAKEGAVPYRVRRSPEVLIVARVWKGRQCVEIASLDDDAAAIRMIEVYLDGSGFVGKYATRLKLAFGLLRRGPDENCHWEGATRPKRVAAYDHWLGTKYPQGSSAPEDLCVGEDRTVKREVEKIIDDMVDSFMSLNVGRSDLADSLGLGRPPTSIRPAGEQSLHVNLREDFFAFRENEVVGVLWVKLEVTAMRSGFLTERLKYRYFADSHPDALRIIPEVGCVAVGPQWFENDYSHLTVRIPAELEVGNFHVMKFRVEVKSNKACRPFLVGQSDYNEGEYRQYVEFASDFIPDKLWRFTNLSHGQLSSLSEPLTKPAEHNGSRYFYSNFPGNQAGHLSGITWQPPKP